MALLEREAELGALSRAWQAVRRGEPGSLLLVSGESGIGKTWLAGSFARAYVHDQQLLWGICDPLTTPRPLGPLHDVVDRLPPAVRSTLESAEHGYLVFPVVHRALCESSYVLVVDDIQWADEATLELLRFLLRRIDRTRSLVIGTYRDDEIGADHPLVPLLGDVARSPSARTVPLRPLSPAGVAALLAAADTAPDKNVAMDAEHVHDLTGGNCFFVSEIASSPADTLPATVRDAVVARTQGLSPDQLSMLMVLAVAPETISDRVLHELGVDLGTLRAFADCGLVERSSRGLRFRHELGRLAIEDTIPPGGHGPLHRRLLQAMERAGDCDPAVLTHHAVAAGDKETAAAHAEQAGLLAARSSSHTSAAEFFRIALDQGGSQLTVPKQAELLELLSVELYLTDRLDAAIEACSRARSLRLSEADWESASADACSLSLYEWYNADRTSAEEHAGLAVDLLHGAPSTRSLALAYATEAYLAYQAGEVAVAHRVVERAAAVADEITDPEVRVRIAMVRAALGVARGQASAREDLLRSIATGRRLGLEEPTSQGYSNLAYLDVEQRRLDSAEAVMTTSLDFARDHEQPICINWQTGARSRLKLMRGEWRSSVEDADLVLEAASAPLTRTWPLISRGLVAVRTGADASHHFLDEAFDLAQRIRDPLRLLPAASALLERSWITGVVEERAGEIRSLAERFAARPEALEWAVGDLLVWMSRVGLPVPRADEVASPYRLLLRGDAAAAAEEWGRLGVRYDEALALLETEEAGTPFVPSRSSTSWVRTRSPHGPAGSCVGGGSTACLPGAVGERPVPTRPASPRGSSRCSR